MDTFTDLRFFCSSGVLNQATNSYGGKTAEVYEHFTDDEYELSCSDEDSNEVRLGFDEVCEKENKLQNEIGLINSLGLKFGIENGAVLANYSKKFWKNDLLYKKSMQFLCMFYTSLRSSYITTEKNWQRKRYCNDVSYLLTLMGYPRLCYFDVNIRPTALCKSFFSSCGKATHSFWALKPSKDNKEHKKWINMKNKAVLENDYQKMYDQKSIPFTKRYTGLVRQQDDNHKDEDFIKFRSGIAKPGDLQIKKSKPGAEFIAECEKNKNEVFKTKSYLEAALKGKELCCKKVLEKILIPSVKKVLIESRKNAADFIEKLNSPNLPNEWKKPKSVYKFTHNKLEYTAYRNYFEPLLESYCRDLDEKISCCNKVSDTLNKEEQDAVSLVTSELRLKRAIMHNEKRKSKEWVETGSKWKKKGIYLRKLAKAKRELAIEKDKKSFTATGLKLKFYGQKRNVNLKKIRKQRIFHSIVKKAGEIPDYLKNVIAFPKLRLLKWDDRAEFAVAQKQLTYHDWYHGIRKEHGKPEKKVKKNVVSQRKSRAERRRISQRENWLVNTEDDECDEAVYIDF